MERISQENAAERSPGLAAQENIRLDRLDEQILWELRRDADITNAALAARLHVSPSTTLSRVRALRAAGVLGAAHADIDYRQLGLSLRAIVAVRLRAQARHQLRAYAQTVAALPNVQDVFFVGGEDDFLIHVLVASSDHLREFIADKLSMDPHVASTQTQIVFEHLSGMDHAQGADGFADLRAL